jgi:hypothetical protein
LVRLALRSPNAPRAETEMSEVVSTVDLVLHVGVVRASRPSGEGRLRRLMSMSLVSGDGDRAVVRELVTLGPEGRWHRVGSLEAAPERVHTKLVRVCEPSRLLDDFDA